jgi:hypothetical protein
VLAWPTERDVPALAKQVAHLATPVLHGISRLAELAAAEKREMRRAALAALVEPDVSDDARVLNGRCLAYGLDPADGICAVAVVDPVKRRVEESVLEDCEAALERGGVPFVAALLHGKIALVVPASVTDNTLAQHLLPKPTVRVGVGRVIFGGIAVPDSWADAKIAADQRSRSSRRRIVRYDELDLSAVLLNEVPLHRLGPKISQLLDPLRSNPLMYETLGCYLRHNQDVGRTARALGLHPNSVRYRLTRAGKILGMSIRSPTTIVALHIALMLDEAVDRTPVAPGHSREADTGATVSRIQTHVAPPVLAGGVRNVA